MQLMESYRRSRAVASTKIVVINDTGKEQTNEVQYVTKVLIGMDLMLLLTTMPKSILYIVQESRLRNYSERVRGCITFELFCYKCVINLCTCMHVWGKSEIALFVRIYIPLIG